MSIFFLSWSSKYSEKDSLEKMECFRSSINSRRCRCDFIPFAIVSNNNQSSLKLSNKIKKFSRNSQNLTTHLIFLNDAFESSDWTFSSTEDFINLDWAFAITNAGFRTTSRIVTCLLKSIIIWGLSEYECHGDSIVLELSIDKDCIICI